ncbi:MAG: hypothetical protein KC432_15870 [Thermomicrobiales bacterium]|nr:hypothetical protein [Thermomicrobiales bacterium]
MDHTRFDALTRGLGQPAGRRHMLGVLLGGVVAVVAAETTDAAKRRKRKRRGRNTNADDSDQAVELPPGTLAGGIWDETIEICHYNAETGRYDVTAVSTVLVPNYLNAGDTLYIDCCTDAECGPLPCLEPTSCVQGACAYDVVEGAPCALNDGSTGYCNSDAVCVVPTYAPVTSTGSESAAYAPPADSGYDPSYDGSVDTAHDQGFDAGYDPAAESGY